MSWKKLHLVRYEILGLFLKKLTSDEKDSWHNKENFPQEIELQLRQKPERFSQSFIFH